MEHLENKIQTINQTINPLMSLCIYIFMLGDLCILFEFAVGRQFTNTEP